MTTLNSHNDVQTAKAYLAWLKSHSLRAIATGLGVSHSTVCTRFQEAYGKDATNPIVMSLQRSILADYPGNPEVEAWVLTTLDQRSTPEDQYRSKHSIQQLTRYQVVRDPGLMDYLAVEDDSDRELEALDGQWLLWFFRVASELTLRVNTVKETFKELQLCEDTYPLSA